MTFLNESRRIILKLARDLHEFSETEQKRNEILISYHGRGDGLDEWVNEAGQCQKATNDADNMYGCNEIYDCKCQDTKNNTFLCKRYLDDEENKVLCRFEDEEKFVEYYDLIKDPYQLYNIPQEESNANERKWVKFSLEKLKNQRRFQKETFTV